MKYTCSVLERRTQGGDGDLKYKGMGVSGNTIEHGRTVARSLSKIQYTRGKRWDEDKVQVLGTR